MKIFKPEYSFPNKINFIDENNVLVGYEIGNQCCETWGYHISKTKMKENKLEKCFKKEDDIPLTRELKMVENYVFDKDYFEEISSNSGGIVIFRLVSKDVLEKELWLHLFNFHNGYYAHGFNFSIPGKKEVIKSL